MAKFRASELPRSAPVELRRSRFDFASGDGSGKLYAWWLVSGDDPPADATKDDVVLVGEPTDSGSGVQVLRRRENRLELGELRTAQHGRPIHGELVRLKPRPESERLFDVEVLVPARTEREQGGPAQVATDAYRTNWDRVFGKPQPN